MGSGGRSSGFYRVAATLEGNHDIQFLYTPLLSLYVICMFHVCVGGWDGVYTRSIWRPEVYAGCFP